MSIELDYELKFHIYDGNESTIDRYIAEYGSKQKEQRDEGSVMSRVISYFFDGMMEIVRGDIEFWNEKINEAHNHYVEADRMFNRFKNSRNVQARLDYLADRMLHRVRGMISLTEGIQSTSEKSDFYREALRAFNSEVNLANEMGETMSSYAAYARASYAESQLLLVDAQKLSENNSGESKKMLMRARGSIRQAAFIDSRFQSRVINIEDRLDDLTKSRILVKAEKYGDEATLASESGEYDDAIILFRKARTFYTRASTLASDTSSRRFLLSSATIYEASEYEALGNKLFRRDNNTSEASEKFADAAKYVEKAIALMGRFGSKNLEDTFLSQRDYYLAMGQQSKAIHDFDQEKYVTAKSLFQEALDLFNKSIELAKSCDNTVIVKLGEEAKGDIQGYLSMCDAMI